MKEELISTLFPILEPFSINPLIIWFLRFCLRNPYEGIIVVNKEGKIEFMDRSTEKFLGFNIGETKYKDVNEILPGTDIPFVLTTGEPLIGRVREIKGKKYLSIAYPLKKDGEIIGAFSRVTFNTLEEIERINKKIIDLNKELQCLKEKQKLEYSSTYTFDDILGESKLIKDVKETAKRISMLNADVLIIGESGTGKELFAHAIHSYQSPDKPFVKINCPAIPFELAEAHLFGYEKGAFTGALSTGKAGAFEIADNGTIFLDEISSLPLSIQAKLLRVLQEREIQRLGSSKTKKINFRLISTTNINLFKLIEEGKFRPDLYYRISRSCLIIPPLRERREDIILYLNHFLKIINNSFKTNFIGFSKEAIEILVNYDWPGNVRELLNVLEQIAINSWNNEIIKPEHLPVVVYFRKNQFSEINPFDRNDLVLVQAKDVIALKEKQLIINALHETKGNKRRAAMLLKMPRSTFYKKIKRYGIFGKFFSYYQKLEDSRSYFPLIHFP